MVHWCSSGHRFSGTDGYGHIPCLPHKMLKIDLLLRRDKQSGENIINTRWSWQPPAELRPSALSPFKDSCTIVKVDETSLKIVL